MGRYLNLENSRPTNNLIIIHESLHDVPRSDMPTNKALPRHTPSLRKSSRVRNVPLGYGFIIENDNGPHIIKNDNLLIYSEAIHE